MTGTAPQAVRGGMYDKIETLKTDFARASVALQISHEPLQRLAGADDVVQMDVRRWTDRGTPREAIHLYPGKTAEVGVTGVDREVRQLVLRVQEARRTFRERVWSAERRELVWIARTTTDAVRRFLVGEDESHLFVAQLTIPATTVAEAHETLRPRELDALRKVRRQGEWFFVPTTPEEQALIRHRITCKGLRKGIGIGSHLLARGRPHIASELVRMESADDRVTEFVRGCVRHADHKTLHLREWARVVRNTEDRSVGATWVD